jgi:6-phosphogluconate dehydrogenase (decarboxylating)
MDYLLRADTESDMDDALIAAGVAQEVTDEDGEVMVLPVAGVTLDRIGSIPARVDEENVIISPGDSRYHANLRVTVDLTAEQIAALPLVDPLPTVPYRVFI